VDVHKLYGEQTVLAKKTILNDSFGAVKRIGGVDCAYIGDEEIIAGLVVLDFNTLRPVYYTFDILKLDFPYIPGLLAYREASAMISVVENACIKPDVLMVDGFGTNHPRRCGIACHVGVTLDMPTIGVGKSFLCGNKLNDDIYQGEERVGRMIYSDMSKKPVYVSPGHRISLDTSVKLVEHCMNGSRIPEPTRKAHEYVSTLKVRLLEKRNKK
jgi:deoxyribonuclease V